VPLSWNEIRHRASTFAKKWKGETREAAERQTFWNEFFNVFGVRRRTIATFEEPVKKLSGDWGFIDLFWPGRLLAEHKSAGADLGKAHAQGMDDIRGLKDTAFTIWNRNRTSHGTMMPAQSRSSYATERQN
jgi:hypothetical protein